LFFFSNYQSRLGGNIQKHVDAILVIEKIQGKCHWLSCICVKQNTTTRACELSKTGSNLQEQRIKVVCDTKVLVKACVVIRHIEKQMKWR